MTQTDIDKKFAAAVRGKFQELQTEIEDRNERITLRDDFIYGDRIDRSLDIPLGHDFTPVNWLRRTVEIHKNMFMSRGFQVISTYDTKDSSMAEGQEDKTAIEVENKKSKEFAEARMKLIEGIMKDNGGSSLWAALAESASAVGDAAIKAYYDEEADRYELCPIESIENLWVLWSRDNFREYDAVAFAYQVSKQEAIDDYGASETVQTSPMGSPMETLASAGVTNQFSGQPGVSILEISGKITGWGAKDGKIVEVKPGDENEFNVLLVGDEVKRVIADTKKIPKYYLFPNKRQRRRPWGMSDVSDAAIQINLTYIETLSDWRTLASKVNFPKFKAFGFGLDTQIPTPESRKIEYLPLSDGQDIVPVMQGDANGIDWQRQLDECKEQFVRETGISRVLFDDPSVTLNSNQALLTSMKPTSDIAEAKKQTWEPIITQIFLDALETVVAYNSDLKDLVDSEENWSLKVMWPSVMQKEDPVYQTMLLNRFNAGTMSVQSYLEAQGESKEELDRLRDEANDPLTAAIIGKQLPALAGIVIQTATAAVQAEIAAAFPEIFGKAQQNQPGVNANGGQAATGQQLTPADNVAGPVSQPGTGATPAGAEGALAQTNQNQGG